MSCSGCIFDVVVDDFVRLLGCSFPFNALPVPMLRQVYFRPLEVRFSLVFFLTFHQNPRKVDVWIEVLPSVY